MKRIKVQSFIYFKIQHSMSVKVAVRVRPFNSRQRKLGCECVVDMQDPATTLKAYQGEEQRRFTFDFSFWSFDNYQEQADGYLKATSPKYADQQQVFERIGKNILDNAWQGYHCCLFAYGQTGSGKSYSMIGYGLNKGIVPITCNEIFERIKKKEQGQEFQVMASMLEIYNEEVQDLTIPIQDRQRGGLKIRQNKLLGVYVDGVKKHRVSSFDQIENVMQQGTKNRTVAATQMNATSSRAHTIITIQFKQIQKSGKSKSEKISMINLVDLAGSQRQGKTGATGQRLKEAVGINQSLTSLGQVISVLAQNSEGANNFVPYRNSALTRILQNALGGNSQTIMICAISPASDNYDESLSTLRYADRAKKIKNKPVVNESASDKMIRELKEQNQRLKNLLQGKGVDISKQQGGSTQVVNSELTKRQEQLKKREEQLLKKEQEQSARLKELQDELAKKEQQNQALLQEKAKQIAELQEKLNNLGDDEEEKKEEVKKQIQDKKKEDQSLQNDLKKVQDELSQKQLEQKKILDQQQLLLKKNEQDLDQIKQNLKKSTKNILPPLNKKGKDNDSSSDDSDDDIAANMHQLQRLLAQMTKDKDQKKKDAQQDQKKMREQNTTTNILNDKELSSMKKKGQLPPYLQNISKDVMINRKMKILLDKKVMTVGKIGCTPPNDIIFGGRDVLVRHASIHVNEGKVFLKPTTNYSHLYVNGSRVTDTVQLCNLDRVIFGWNSIYLFKNVHDDRTDEKIRDQEITWDFVGKEVQRLVDIDQSDNEDGGGGCCSIF